MAAASQEQNVSLKRCLPASSKDSVSSHCGLRYGEGAKRGQTPTPQREGKRGRPSCQERLVVDVESIRRYY